MNGIGEKMASHTLHASRFSAKAVYPDAHDNVANRLIIDENHKLHASSVFSEEQWGKRENELLERIRVMEHDLTDKLFVNRELTDQNCALERERDGLQIRYDRALSEREVWYTNGTTIDGTTAQPSRKQEIERSKRGNILPSTLSIPGETQRVPMVQPEEIDLMKMTQLQNDKLQDQIMDLKRQLKDYKRRNEALDTQVHHHEKQWDRTMRDKGNRPGDIIAAKEVDEQYKNKLKEKEETIHFLEQTLKIVQKANKDAKDMVTKSEYEKIQAKLLNYEQEYNQLTVALGDAQRGSTASKTESSTLKGKLLQLEKDYKEIQAQYKEVKKNNDNLKAILMEMEKTQTQLRQTVEQSEKMQEKIKLESQQYEQLSEDTSKKLSSQSLEIDRLKRNVKDLIGEKDELMEELDGRDKRVQLLDIALRGAQEENSKLESGLSEAQQRFQNQLVQSERKDIEIKRLNREIETTTADGARFREEIQFKKEEVQHAREDLSTLTQENQFLNSKLVKACEERDMFKRRLEQSIARCTELEHIVRNKEIEYNDLLQNYRTVTNENSRASVTIESYEQDNKELQQRLSIRSEELERLNERIRSVDDEQQRYVMELQAFQFHNEKQANKIVELQESINELRKEKEGLLTERSDTMRQAHELRMEKSESQKEMVLLMKRVEVLAHDNDNLQAKIDKERNHVKSLQDELVRGEVTEQRVQQLKTRVEELEDAIKEKSEKISKQKNYLFKYESQLNGVSSDLALSREREAALIKELNAVRQDMDNVRESLTRREAAISNESDIQLQLRERESQLTTQVRSLREDLHKLQSKYVALRQDNARLQDLVTKMDADRDALQREYSTLAQSERRLQGVVRDMSRM